MEKENLFLVMGEDFEFYCLQLAKPIRDKSLTKKF